MEDKKTVQQIADTLGLSRNTVSKVINNKKVSENTRERVINKAIELGYKGFNQLRISHSSKNMKILLLTGKPLSNLDFFISLVRGVENLTSQHNIDLFQYTMHLTTPFEQLNNYVKSLNIDGIIGIELYEKKLLDNVFLLNKPIVFIDAICDLNYYKGNYDTLLMHSRDQIYSICRQFITLGFNRLSFCGDYKHCQGFYERFLGMRDALADINHRMDLNHSILFSDESPYGDIDWLSRKISSLPIKPHVFICANDSIAINVVQALKKLNIQVPKDIQVVGFDNTTDASIYEIPITTVNVNKENLGQEALYTLIDRINRPNTLNRTIYVQTETIYRETTLSSLKR